MKILSLAGSRRAAQPEFRGKRVTKTVLKIAKRLKILSKLFVVFTQCAKRFALALDWHLNFALPSLGELARNPPNLRVKILNTLSGGKGQGFERIHSIRSRHSGKNRFFACSRIPSLSSLLGVYFSSEKTLMTHYRNAFCAAVWFEMNGIFF